MIRLPFLVLVAVLAFAVTAQESSLETQLLEAETADAAPHTEQPADTYSKTRLFPLMKHEQGDDYEEFEAGDVIIGEAYDYERHGDHRSAEFVDLPLVSGVRTERHGEDREVRVGKVPFVTVFEAEHGEDSHNVEVVDVPFFTLAQSTKSENGNVDTKVVKLPIFGSLFRHTRTDDTESVRFLFFSHTRTIEKDDVDEPREPIKRAKGKPLAR